MGGKNLIRLRAIPALVLLVLLAAGCAAPDPSALPPDSSPIPAAGDRPAVLNGIDEALIAALGGLLPPEGEWPPREKVHPAPAGTVIATRSIPLSSLAYLPRLRPTLEAELARAGYPNQEIRSYPIPGGEAWELTVTVEEYLAYRVQLAARIDGRVAVIIDDCGHSLRNRDRLLAIDYPLTLAVLPRLGYTSAVARLAAEQGFEVILHCPMEGLNPELSPGPGALERGMPVDELAAILAENIRVVPGAVGLNNHMGSAFTTDPEAMGRLMGELKLRGLFFVDSLTSPGTATGEAAEAAGVRHLFRDVFLDHEKSEEFILGQLEVLKQKAARRGFAIAIGHDRPLTVEILARELPSLAEARLQLVPVSDLLDIRDQD